MNDNKDAGLEELKELLLKDEREAIFEIKERFDNFQQRKIDVASVLPAAIQDSSQQQGAMLIEAMRIPVLEAIAISSHRDHEHLSDALAAVIGPAILRSISETLRKYTETMETMARNNFTLKGLKWRFEAKSTGISFSEIVLKHTLLYRVEELYLIHKPSGLLISHAAHPGLMQNYDKDAVAGMMSAIHSFSREALMSDSSDSLEAVDLGGRLLRLVQGSHAMLACVNRGTTPPAFLTKARQTLDDIHRQFHHNLREYNGDASTLKDINFLLEPLLAEDSLDSNKTAKKSLASSSFIKALGLILALTIGWSVYKKYENLQNERLLAINLEREQHAKLILEQESLRIRTVLETLPGLMVARVDRIGDNWVISGLSDPLGLTPTEISQALSMDLSGLQLNLRPYLSLDPVLSLKRAQAILAPPPSVTIAFKDAILYVKGEAESKWIEGARYHVRVHLPPYFSHIDLSGLTIKNNKKTGEKK